MSVRQGLTLMELIVVLVIVAISAGLAFVSMRAGIANREAKQATETARGIAHAVRMYEIEKGSLPTQSNLSEVFTQGFLKSDEFAQGGAYQFSFVANPLNPPRWRIEARRTNPTTRLIQAENRGDHFEITDSG